MTNSKVTKIIIQMNNLNIINNEYKLARAKYLNFVETEDIKKIGFEAYDKMRISLHNEAFRLLKELNLEYLKVYKRPLINKDLMKRFERQLVYDIKGAPYRK